jgi:two-component system, chemotaxis family, chemotaxis protein CheY
MKTVLLVDDSRAVRMAGRKIVESLGCGVLEACNGQDAMRVCSEHPEVDAILLDWDMPIMNGLEFLKSLRAGSNLQPIVLMCTTHNGFTDISEALAAGANEYVMKPFTGDIIKEKLQEAGVL